MSHPPQTEPPPTLLGGRYAIERELGRGASAFVYLARDLLQDGRLVAVKVLRPELAESLGADRFLREVRTTRRLDHPCIVPVLDEGAEGDRLYFVTPYMDGGTLRERLTKERQLSIGTAVAIAQSVAAALEHAHAQGIIHRDVKPENILFAGDEARLADFGIARVLDDAVGWTTTTGLVRGTPAYMSPEQAAGERDLDGRSDVYSLGIVLYEMLAGLAPFAAATPERSIAQRLTHPPEALTRYRPMVPPELDEAVRIALATTRADRFASARAFAEALAGTGRTLAGGGALVWVRDRSPAAQRTDTFSRTNRARRWPRLVMLATGGVALAAATYATRERIASTWRPHTEAIDTTVLLVLPPEPVAESRVTVSPQLTERLHAAFRRWQGLTLVDAFQVDSALRTDLDAARGSPAKLARSLGAGRYARTQVTHLGDSLSVYAVLYQVGLERPLYQAAQRVSADVVRGRDSGLQALADSLLLRGRPLGSGSVGSTSLPATQAMVRARAALDEWDLPVVDSILTVALQYDRQASRIAYWLAQVKAWRGESQAKWRELAERGTADSTAVQPIERALARGLAALAREEYARACDAYDTARALEPDEFAAWYGTAQCHDLDHVVVPDRRTTSGWRFRSSYGRAIEAYTRALELLPRAHRAFQHSAYEPLRRVLITDPTDGRLGHAVLARGARSDTIAFLARASLVNDTLAFIPYPIAEAANATRPVVDSTLSSAVARGRTAFQRIAAAWQTAMPNDASVKEAVAISLELRNDPSAVDTLRAARRLARDDEQRLHLAAEEVILRIKFAVPDHPDELASALHVADSLLTVGARSARGAAALLPVAAVAGNCSLVQSLARMSAEPLSSPFVATRDVVGSANALTLAAVLGCPGVHVANELSGIAGRVIRPRSSGTATSDSVLFQLLVSRAVTRSSVLDSLWLRRLSSTRGDYLIRVQNALVHGDTAEARVILANVAARRRLTGTVVTIDAAVPEARAHLSLGDTVGARSLLDAAIVAVRAGSPGVLADPVAAASLSRALEVRLACDPASSSARPPESWHRSLLILRGPRS